MRASTIIATVISMAVFTAASPIDLDANAPETATLKARQCAAICTVQG
jgi:hypothetical protein